MRYHFGKGFRVSMSLKLSLLLFQGPISRCLSPRLGVIAYCRGYRRWVFWSITIDRWGRGPWLLNQARRGEKKIDHCRFYSCSAHRVAGHRGSRTQTVGRTGSKESLANAFMSGVNHGAWETGDHKWTQVQRKRLVQRWSQIKLVQCRHYTLAPLATTETDRMVCLWAQS